MANLPRVRSDVTPCTIPMSNVDFGPSHSGEKRLRFRFLKKLAILQMSLRAFWILGNQKEIN